MSTVKETVSALLRRLHRAGSAGCRRRCAPTLLSALLRPWRAASLRPAPHGGHTGTCSRCQCEGGERDAGPLLHRAHTRHLWTRHAAHAAAGGWAYGSASVGVAVRV